MAHWSLALLVALAFGGCKSKKASPADSTAEGLDLELAEDDFTIVLMPDTQYYMGPHRDHFEAQANWLVESADALRIRYVVHLGDMTDRNSESEWKVVDEILTPVVEKLPFAPLPGNHDGVKYGRFDTSLYNRHFGAERMQQNDSYGTHGPGGNESHFGTFRAGDVDYLILSVTFGSPAEHLEWAGEVAAAHPDHRILLATHAYLDDDGTTLDRGEEYAVEAERWTDGRTIWDQLVRRHPNIDLVACGHVPGNAHSTAQNDAGEPVHQVLANYQGEAEGGGGFLRILHVRPAARAISVVAYSPSSDEKWSGDRHSFELTWPP